MIRGFYNLTSGMLSQSRRLDMVAGNLTNVSTSGYKAGQYVDSTFSEVLYSRVGNKIKTGAAALGTQSYMLAPSELRTNFAQGPLEESGMALDFAIEGEGYFAVEGEAGRLYTRNGSFSLDEEGYLCLGGQGRVLDISGEPLLLGTDKIQANSLGEIMTENGGYLGRLGVFTFGAGTALERNVQGMFTAAGEPEPAQGAAVHWKWQERSNVDLMQQMATMMTSQRALQSAAQVSKIYDQLMTKATTELSRL